MRKLGVVAATFGGLTLVGASIVWACGGTSKVPCSQTMYLGPIAGQIHCHPPPDVSLDLPHEVALGCFWGTTLPIWPVPGGVTLETEIVFLELGGAVPIPIPLDAEIMPTPTVPGLQAPYTQTITVPANTLDPTKSYIGTVTSTACVQFVGGTAPLLCDTQISELCVVPKSPHLPDEPEFDMFFMPEFDGVDRVRRGDANRVLVGLTNNNALQSLTVDVSGSGRQFAKLPDGGTPDIRYAISDPSPGTDSVDIEIVDLSLTGCEPVEIYRGFDPMEVSDRFDEITSLTLGPGESTVVALDTRSHGMCADGSCGGQLIKALAQWDDLRPAVACLNSLHVVDNAAPGQGPLQEITDEIKSAPERNAFWGQGNFGQPNAITHFEGNLLGLADQPSGQTTTAGVNTPDAALGFPQLLQDTLRVLTPTTEVQFQVDSFANIADASTFNFIRISSGQPIVDVQIAIPLVQPNPPTGNFGAYDIDIDPAANTITVTPGGSMTPVHSGALSAFDSFNGNDDIVLERGTCRTITFGDLPLDRVPICIDPPLIAVDVPERQVVSSEHCILDPITLTELGWGATSDHSAISVRNFDTGGPFGPTATGAAGDKLEVQIDSALLNPGFSPTAENLAPVIADAVRVEATGAPNTEQLLPVIARKTPTQFLLPGLTKLNINHNLKKPGNSTMSLQGVILDPFAPDGTLEGQTVAIEVGGGPPQEFVLDRKGKGTLTNGDFAKGPKQTIKVSRSKKKGTMKIKFVAKKSTLDFLADEGIEDGPTVKKKAGETRTVTVGIFVGGGAFGGDIEGTFTRKEGKKAGLKAKVAGSTE